MLQHNIVKANEVIKGEIIDANINSTTVTADATVIHTKNYIQVMATIQIVVPTERELFSIIIDRIQKLDKNIVETKKDIKELTSSLVQIKSKLPIVNVQNKKLITVEMFTEIYSIQEETQRILRGRRKDSLPFIQLTPRGKILYDVKVINKWMENFEKS